MKRPTAGSKAKASAKAKQPPVPKFRPLRKSVVRKFAKFGPSDTIKIGGDKNAVKALEELHRKISGLGLIYEKAHEIEQWADYRFTTKEGRIFGLYEDGESILGRFAAKPVTINWEDTKGIERVESIAGFVMEIGTDDQPFVFQDDFHLGKFWLDLHTTYQVELTAEECELLVEDLGVPNVRDREGDGEGTD